MDHYKYFIPKNEVTKILNLTGTRLSKTHGQNILINPRLIESIILHLDPDPDDRVLEIGSGLGALTLPLAQTVAKVTAVEIDPKLASLFRNRLKDTELAHKIRLISTDFLKLNPSTLGPFEYKILSSLPYRQTPAIIHRLINEFYLRWNQAVLIVQKEVSARFFQGPPHSNYWFHYLNLFYELRAEIKSIGPANFYPQPQVQSTLITLKRKVPSDAITPIQWSTFLHYIFRAPRKQLRKILPQFTLNDTTINPTARAETLTIQQLLHLWKKSSSATTLTKLNPPVK